MLNFDYKRRMIQGGPTVYSVMIVEDEMLVRVGIAASDVYKRQVYDL